MSVRLALMVSLLLASHAGAQNFTFGDFTNVANLAMNGTAVQSGMNLRLTQAATSQAGTAYYFQPQPVALGFDTTFIFQITSPGGLAPGAADGMVFIVHNDPLGVAALGGNGGALAYGGTGAITNSLVIEIVDTWVGGGGTPCPDTGTNEISVHTNGTAANGATGEMLSIGSATASVSLADGLAHTMRILYVPGTLEIYVDNLPTPELVVPYDFATGATFSCAGGTVGGLSLLQDHAWVGFGAATGGAWQVHEVLTWTWASTTPPACYAGTVGAGAGSPSDVLLINGTSGGFGRRVTLTTYAALSINVLQPPSAAIPAPFVLFGTVGTPTPGGGLLLPFGELCFPPALTPAPNLFVLADSFNLNIGAFIPATPAPWGIVLPAGFPVPVDLTLQGVVLESPGALAVTNAVEIEVESLPAPTITSITPLSAAPGANISVVGSGFHFAASVTVDGLPVAATSVTPGQVDFPYPAGTGCDATLVVTNPDGQAATGTLNPTPNIIALSPSTGSAAGGATLLVIGSGFAPGSSVTVGGVPAGINTVSTSLINCTTPSGATGSAPVVVTTPGGCTTSATYTYQ